MKDVHQERKQEEERLHDVMRVIEKKVAQLDQKTDGLKEDVIQLRRTFWDDVRINIDNPKEVLETYWSMKQQAETLSERERTHRLLHKQRKMLSRLKESAYFARIDFMEEGEETVESIYIGVGSLMAEDEQTFLIYDWRAPISSMYYDHMLGPAQYKTVEGVIRGELSLKRQFVIRNGQIITMFDSGLTVGDDLLKEVLGSQAGTKMKNIVATIQQEQNQVIRNLNSKYLIVQGVAGSGKTSAALQRVAYLLYRFKDQITADQILLFSPNALFNRYIASVLPDLGEDNIQQLTFQEYIERRLGKRFEVEDSFAQMEEMLTSEDDKRHKARQRGARYKGSVEFKRVLDAYVKLLSTEGLIFKNIMFREEKLISAERIKHYFYQLDTSISIPNRMQLVKKWLLKELAKKEEWEQSKEWVAEESELLDHAEYTEVFQELLKEGKFSGETFNDFEQEQEQIARRVVKKYFRPIRKAVKKLKFLNLAAVYGQLFQPNRGTHQQLQSQPPEGWEEICAYTLQKLRRKELPYEDAAPYVYLQDQLEGSMINTRIRHVFIDEAQDYSPLQFYVIKQLFPHCRMTILGDANQAIYAHALNAPTLLSSGIMDEEQVEKVTLTKSYRSTRQIVEFSREIIAEGGEIEAFNRNGPKPTLTKVENPAALRSRIVEQIRQLQSANHKTIAIICKTEKECRQAYERLSGDIEIQLMGHASSSYQKGVLILPAYLSKGIEFDAVIIYDASATTYGRESERKLFYTACTRAMHELHLFALGVMSPFMKTIPANLYETTA